MRRTRNLLFGRLLPCAAALALIGAAFLYLAVRLPQALAPVAFGERLLCIFAGLFVLNFSPEENKPLRLFLLLLLPYLGALCCFFLRKERSPAPLRGHPFGGAADSVSAIAHTLCGVPGGYARSAEYFPTGKEMSVRLLGDLQGAKKEILLDYYLLAQGKFFGGVLAALEKKAREGVRVRLVYDDFGCAKTLPKKFYKTLRARGIDAEVFRPFRPLPFSKLNRRDHRKLAVIDGEILYVGGVNLADEYIGEEIRFGHWKDCALRVLGAPAKQAAAYFKGETAHEGEDEGVPCVPFFDRAETGVRAGEEILFKLIGSATETLYLCTPYLAPTAKLFAALQTAARGGADVRLMIPHIPDKKLVLMFTRDYARRLSAAGVKVREYTAGFLHAKSLVADGRYVFSGSYNLDRRSLCMQAENGVFIEDARLAADLERDFHEIWETGREVKRAALPEKIFCFLFRPLAHLI